MKWLLVTAVLLLCVSCSAEESDAQVSVFSAGSVTDGANRSGDTVELLAFSHSWQIEVARSEELERIFNGVVDQCNDATEYSWTLLSSEIFYAGSPAASVQMRVSANGIGPLTGLATEKGVVRHRVTSVDDRAKPIASVANEIARLRRQQPNWSASWVSRRNWQKR